MTVDIKKAKENFERREKERQSRLDISYKKAMQDFEKITSMIIRDYNPLRIYQWGSLLNRENFSEISDIDIAVEGKFSAEQFFEMLGKAMDMTNFSVDLVEIDKIEPLHADSIKKKGKLIYERK